MYFNLQCGLLMLIVDFVSDPVLAVGGGYGGEHCRCAVPQGAYILRGKTQKLDQTVKTLWVP